MKVIIMNANIMNFKRNKLEHNILRINTRKDIDV